MKPLNQMDPKKGSIICVYFYMRKGDAGCELVSWVAITTQSSVSAVVSVQMSVFSFGFQGAHVSRWWDTEIQY